MKIDLVPIDSVKPYFRNPRFNDPAVPEVKKSLAEFGWNQPIVVDVDKVIIVGHTRLRAAKELGMKEIPIFVAGHLRPEQAKAYRLMDNRSGQFAKWDNTSLFLEIDELSKEFNSDFNTDFLGFLAYDFSLPNEFMSPEATNPTHDEEETVKGEPEADPWASDIESRAKVDGEDENELGIMRTIKVRLLQEHSAEFVVALRELIGSFNGELGEITLA